ncbi:MAG: hypothetical protein ABW007_22710 [Chitinophagaceae bacterium]
MSKFISNDIDPNTAGRDKEYTPSLDYYQPDLHDKSEGSEYLDENLRMTEQPLLFNSGETDSPE